MPACEISSTGLLRCSGADAGAFLHSQLTSDIAALDSGRSQYSGYCTPKGRLLASFLVWRNDADYWLQLPRALAEPIRRRLSMYVLRAKVSIADVSGAYSAWGLFDDLTMDITAVPESVHAVSVERETMVVRLPVDRRLVVVPLGDSTAFRTRLGSLPDNPAVWDRLDIAAGVPTITPQTQEEFVPQMVNFDRIGALSYTKGCYPGQEIVARTHYLGRLKQRMVRARLTAAGEPGPGDKLYSASVPGQSSGLVVRAAPSAEGGYELLAVIQTKDIGLGDVRWRAPDGPAIEQLPLPYTVTG